MADARYPESAAARPVPVFGVHPLIKTFDEHGICPEFDLRPIGRRPHQAGRKKTHQPARETVVQEDPPGWTSSSTIFDREISNSAITCSCVTGGKSARKSASESSTAR
jgi:hypothetical protein